MGVPSFLESLKLGEIQFLDKAHVWLRVYVCILGS